MELVGLLKLPIPEIKVSKRKSGSWGVKTQVFGRKEDPKTGDITYGTLNHDCDMGINTAIHDAIAHLCYCHRAELGNNYFGKVGWQKVDGATIALTNEEKMKLSPLLVYNQDLEQYVKNLQMDILEALFDKEALREELETQKLKVAQQEKQDLEIQKPCDRKMKKPCACKICGEIGHTHEEHKDGCPHCEGNHPAEECPTRQVTCFLCEGTTHYPAQCQIYPKVQEITKQQKEAMKEALRESLKEPVIKEDVEDPDGEGLTRFYSNACYSCGQEGHLSQYCTKERKEYLGYFSTEAVVFDPQEIEGFIGTKKPRKRNQRHPQMTTLYESFLQGPGQRVMTLT